MLDQIIGDAVITFVAVSGTIENSREAREEKRNKWKRES